MTARDIFNVLLALTLGADAALFWPWDWRGKRRAVKLKRGRRPWE